MAPKFQPGLAALVSSLGLVACAVGPNYTAPSPPSAQAFRNAPPATESDHPAPALERWWEGFHDRELTSLVTRALRQNLDLAQADARLGQARAAARAAGADLLPAGQANAQGEYQYQSLQNPTARVESAFPGFQRYQKLYDLNAGASWEPDLFGGLRRAAQGARARYEASQASRVGARIAVAAATAEAYVDVRALQDRLTVAEASLRAESDLAALTRLRFDRGVASRAELDQAEAEADGAQAVIPALRSALEARTNALEVLVGETPGALHAELSTPGEIPPPPGVDAFGGPAALIRRRPDVIAAERTLAAADAGIGAALAEYYPKVSLSGVVGYEASDLSRLVTPAAFQPQGVVGVRWRLFDFGRVDAEVAAARGARAEALAAYRQSVLKATADVESALAALAGDETNEAALATSETSLARSLDSTNAAATTGHASQVEGLVARTRLLAARDEHLQSRQAVAQAAITVYQALGGGW